MPTYKATQYRSALEKKGFRLERRTNDYLYYFYYDGKKTSIHTKVSMGKGEDIRVKLLSMIRHQLRLDNSTQLQKFIECPMEYPDYVQHLKVKGVIQ